MTKEQLEKYRDKILDGKALSAELRREIAQRALAVAARGAAPGLAVILIGENPASVSYVTAKEKACAEAGIRSFPHHLPTGVAEAELLDLIAKLNADPAVHGILAQLPLPRGFDERKVIRAIAPWKDVDGFHPENAGKLLLGDDDGFEPCTPHGIMEMIRRAGIPTRGAHAVVVGRSNIVGKPIAAMLARKGVDATVTVCHTGTGDLGEFTRAADILVVAAGRPSTVTADMVKDGAVVIDVGVNRIPDGTKKSGFRLAGDVDFDGVIEKAGKITPVPGGVGPLTITMLLDNTVTSAARAAGMDCGK